MRHQRVTLCLLAMFAHELPRASGIVASQSEEADATTTAAAAETTTAAAADSTSASPSTSALSAEAAKTATSTAAAADDPTPSAAPAAESSGNSSSGGGCSRCEGGIGCVDAAGRCYNTVPPHVGKLFCFARSGTYCDGAEGKEENVCENCESSKPCYFQGSCSSWDYGACQTMGGHWCGGTACACANPFMGPEYSCSDNSLGKCKGTHVCATYSHVKHDELASHCKTSRCFITFASNGQISGGVVQSASCPGNKCEDGYCKRLCSEDPRCNEDGSKCLSKATAGSECACVRISKKPLPSDTIAGSTTCQVEEILSDAASTLSSATQVVVRNFRISGVSSALTHYAPFQEAIKLAYRDGMRFCDTVAPEDMEILSFPQFNIEEGQPTAVSNIFVVYRNGDAGKCHNGQKVLDDHVKAQITTNLEAMRGAVLDAKNPIEVDIVHP
eukprot:TRINITY_DN30996_c0_g1_i1.p1 TRINITY_DN30996_c0_g1~~TRINITY_DN30996_c0_g1_i1.p1  ORF type:complete len:444 (+),score=63.22 TRINITY_DN30996_c0_g1_i1:76-1407(+)